MKRTLPLAVLALLLTACSHSHPHTTLYAQSQPEAAAQCASIDAAARAAANALIASMSDEQRANTVLPLDHDARGDWHFVPRRRPGLALGDMTDAQRHHLHHLLQSGLSDSGYLKAIDIVWLESVLQELENGNLGRDPGRYTLLLFGDPAPGSDDVDAGGDSEGDSGGAWGWRFEGHHLSLNFTYAGDDVVTTPMFMGTAPAVVPHGLHAGKRILADEHNLAFELVATLSDEQREQMMIGAVPGDVATGPGREQSLREPAGIEIKDLTGPQETLLLELMSVHIGRVEIDHLHDFVTALMAGQDIYFAWAGSTNPEEPHYYRIYAQDLFVVEYCTRDGGVDHIHGVFHDLTDPLAEDLLRRHFEEHHGAE